MSTATLLKAKELLATPELPDIGPGPRAGVSSPAQINQAFEQGIAVPGPEGELTRALLLLWHDHLEPAHLIAQSIETPDGSFVHGIMHRREPDYSNAKFWFNRMGQHPCFVQIAPRVNTLLDMGGEHDLRAKLLPYGEWDASAFVDACEQAAPRPPADKRRKVLRQLQRIETQTLLEYLLKTKK